MAIKITKIVNELNSSTPSSSTNRKSLIQRNRVLDQHARDRRRKQQLAQLERDNFHDDPHANLVMHKKAPKFEDTINTASTPNRKSTSSTLKIKSLTFSTIVEDDVKLNPYANYLNSAAPAPDSMYVGNAELRRRFFNEWLIAQSDKEPNENELNSNSDENDDLMEVEEKVTDSKKKSTTVKYDEQDDPNSYKRILTVVRRHFCCVCGFQAVYTCVTCGMRYCCSSCLKTHRDTRCLKWTV